MVGVRKAWAGEELELPVGATASLLWWGQTQGPLRTWFLLSVQLTCP